MATVFRFDEMYRALETVFEAWIGEEGRPCAPNTARGRFLNVYGANDAGSTPAGGRFLVPYV